MQLKNGEKINNLNFPESLNIRARQKSMLVWCEVHRNNDFTEYLPQLSIHRHIA